MNQYPKFGSLGVDLAKNPYAEESLARSTTQTQEFDAPTVSLLAKWALLIYVLLIGRPLVADKPNVVMLLSDDLGWKDISCYDGPVRTPTLDRLASEGTRFTQFYSGAAVCSPSRAVLLTGRTNLRCGIYSWINDNDQRCHLPTAEVTLAEILKREGYATAHFGKWHLGMPTANHPQKPTPSDHGFEYWFATANNATPSHRNPKNFIRNGKPTGQLEGYACDLVVNDAIKWLDNRSGKQTPFFLNVWLHEPHAPLAAPDVLVREYGDVSDPAAIYSATIANTDRAIDRLIQKLHSVAAPENTIIIYASDNGSYRPDRVGNLRGTKGSNYEGGLRVPGIFYWPGQINRGTTLDEPAGLVDVLPTVCGLIGIDCPPVQLDGTDLSSLLCDVSTRDEEDVLPFQRSQPLFWALPLSGPAIAMRDGRYNMVAYRSGKLPKDKKALDEIKRKIEQLLRDKGIFASETRGSTFGKQLFEGFSDSDAERLRGQFIRLNQFHESWIPELKRSQFIRFELYDLEADPAQTADIALRKPIIHARMKSQILKLAESALGEAFDWSSARPAPAREPTTQIHRFDSQFRSPFDAFVYLNRIPIEPEAFEDPEGLASRIESRLANQEGRVQIKLPSSMGRDAYEGFKLAAGIGLTTSCFACHRLPDLRGTHLEPPAPTLRNLRCSPEQFRKSMRSESHMSLSSDQSTNDRLFAFLGVLNDVPDSEFRPLILNATVLETSGDIE